MLGWLVADRIEPHIPVPDNAGRRDGTFCDADFRHDPEGDDYTCPGGKPLKTYWRQMKTPRDGIGKDGSRTCCASQKDRSACALKKRCTPP